MIDDHFHPEHWGIRPELFSLWGVPVSSYSFFVFFGLVVGAIFFFGEARRRKSLNDHSFFIAVGGLVGGILGAKLFVWVLNFPYLLEHASNPEVWLSGRTITGGLIGGAIGAFLTKKKMGITEKKGNLFAPGVALGMAIGRIGCFLQGCCYGKATGLSWWGVDFGDGVLRHPTQLYEAAFMVGMFLYLQKRKKRKDVRPGELFRTLLIGYFGFRFFIEYIRVEPEIFLGFTFFQIVSVCVMLYVLRDTILVFLKKKFAKSWM